MATETTSSTSGTRNIAHARKVGNCFASHYYNVMHQCPKLLHHFYKQSSKISWADGIVDGAFNMPVSQSVLHKKIILLNYADCITEITSIDSNESPSGGILVTITGSLSRKLSSGKRKFGQTFYLASQENGYFVQNDVFRFINCDSSSGNLSILQASQELAGLEVGVSNFTASDLLGDVSEISVQKSPITVDGSPPESSGPSGSCSEQETENKDLLRHVSEISAQTSLITADGSLPESPGSSGSHSEQETENTVSLRPSITATSASTCTPHTAGERMSCGPFILTEVDGRTVLIKNLPDNTSYPQLKAGLGVFGEIVPYGVQIRKPNQGLGYCFATFKVPSSAQNCIKASSLLIGDFHFNVLKLRPVCFNASLKTRSPASGLYYRHNVLHSNRMLGGKSVFQAGNLKNSSRNLQGKTDNQPTRRNADHEIRRGSVSWRIPRWRHWGLQSC